MLKKSILSYGIFLTTIILARQIFSPFITANPELYFRAVLANAQDVLTLWWWDTTGTKYKLLYNGTIKLEKSCSKGEGVEGMDTISIYKFIIDKERRTYFLNNKLLITFPWTTLPFKTISTHPKLKMIYPIFKEAVEVYRYTPDGFWIKVINASGFINAFTLKIDVPSGDGEQFANAFKGVLKVEDKPYEVICPTPKTFPAT